MGGRVYGDEEGLKRGTACGCGLDAEGVESVAGVALPLVVVRGRVREKQQLAFNMAVTYS